MRKFSQIQSPIWLLKTIAKLCLKQKQKMLNLVTNPVTNSIALSKYYCKTILRIKAMHQCFMAMLRGHALWPCFAAMLRGNALRQCFAAMLCGNDVQQCFMAMFIFHCNSLRQNTQIESNRNMFPI